MRFKYINTDYHVHTKWSHDIRESGLSFEDYIKIAEKNKINICFLDHYELYYVQNDKNYPFYDNKIVNYLEEVDKVKESYNFALSGLEMDYYADKESEIRNFLDDYGKNFDFIAGAIHETEYGYPITTREKLLKLVARKPIKQIIDDFFDLSEKMIKSKIFKNICHLDTIFRYINVNDIIPTEDCDISDDRVLKLGQLCIKNKISIEYNLSGQKFPINRTFPSDNVINQLKKEGANVFVGSDSHSIVYFENTVFKVKRAYKFLNSIK